MPRELQVRSIPPGYGVWRGFRYQTQSFDLQARRGYVVELSRRVTSTGQVSILYRRLRAAPAPWVRPARMVGVTVGVLAGASVLLYLALRELWVLLVVMAPYLTGIAVLSAILLSRLGHRGACPGIVVHCKGCR